MLVEKRMRKNPQTATPEDYLASALAKMHKGGFRRLPVVKDGKLAGIITDRDLRASTLPVTLESDRSKEGILEISLRQMEEKN